MTNEKRDEIRQKAREWRTTQRTYPAQRGTNALSVTPEQFDEALTAFAEFLLSGGAATITLDRCIAIAKEVSEKHSTCSRLCLATSVAVAVWDEQDDAGAAPPAASPHAQAQAIVDAITADMMAESLEKRAASSSGTPAMPSAPEAQAQVQAQAIVDAITADMMTERLRELEERLKGSRDAHDAEGLAWSNAMPAMIAAAVAAEREECAKLVCYLCRDERPTTLDGQQWRHRLGDSGLTEPCYASAIRSRASQPEPYIMQIGKGMKVRGERFSGEAEVIGIIPPKEAMIQVRLENDHTVNYPISSVWAADTNLEPEGGKELIP